MHTRRASIGTGTVRGVAPRASSSPEHARYLRRVDQMQREKGIGRVEAIAHVNQFEPTLREAAFGGAVVAGPRATKQEKLTKAQIDFAREVWNRSVQSLSAQYRLPKHQAEAMVDRACPGLRERANGGAA